MSKNWGGYREGSGRKLDSDGRTEYVSAQVKKGTKDKIKEEANKKGISVSKLVGNVLDNRYE